MIPCYFLIDEQMEDSIPDAGSLVFRNNGHAVVIRAESLTYDLQGYWPGHLMTRW